MPRSSVRRACAENAGILSFLRRRHGSPPCICVEGVGDQYDLSGEFVDTTGYPSFPRCPNRKIHFQVVSPHPIHARWRWIPFESYWRIYRGIFKISEKIPKVLKILQTDRRREFYNGKDDRKITPSPIGHAR